ncbi:hypothetical protein BKA67DRAFT_662635 [Truncatella angustata]|uniref:Uncharacterized protein n=1 Tax=Truncatella angustata TaxID=152316 RepID=A0A9P8UD92_9PEZI|nr:uncharacterized protein BKA67DRAFT_662635 [Truncatella angustata]KAH6647888.1 hypothetical protein BKA67DRAFT_662635 [Truncatella angustata]
MAPKTRIILIIQTISSRTGVTADQKAPYSMLASSAKTDKRAMPCSGIQRAKQYNPAQGRHRQVHVDATEFVSEVTHQRPSDTETEIEKRTGPEALCGNSK